MGTGLSRPNSREHTTASMRPSSQEGAASNLEVTPGSGVGEGAAKEVTFGRVRSVRGDDEMREALKERGCVLDGVAVDAMRQRASSISLQMPQGMDEIDIIMELYKNDQKTVQGEKFLHKTRFGEEEGGKAERPNLEHLLGSVDGVSPLRCMYAEHCMSELADLEFDTAWGARTTPAKEWEYVIGVGGLDLETWTLREPREKPESPRGKMERQKAVGRNRWSVLGLHHKNKAFVAKLTVEEVCALRLLTGPMSSIYNRALRSGDEGKAGKWANTMLVAVSGIVKLSAVSAPVPSGKLFRVLSNNNNNNRVTSQDFEEMKDAQGYVWEIDRGFMSATSSLDVAREKTSSQFGSTLILEMTVSARLSLPADLTWLSQFEHEKEYVYAPGAHIELLSSIPRRHKAHTHLSVAVTRNTEAQTLEMAALNPSRAIQTVAKRSFCGLRNTLLASFGAAWGEDVSSKALDDVRKSPSEWFLNDWRCAVAVDEIVRARDRERRLVVQEVMRRGDEAAQSGDMQEAAMIYMSGYSIVEGLWSEEETGRGDALLELQERLVTSMESGGFALPGKEKGRLAKLSFQSGEHKKAHGLFAGLVKEMKVQAESTWGGGADSEKKAELQDVLLGAGEASKAVGRFSESTGYFKEIIDEFEAPPQEQGLSAFLTTAPDMTGGVDTTISSPRDEEKRRVAYAQALRGMGDVLASKGDDDEATGYYERASRQITKVLGMRHPEMATLLVSQSWTLKRLGNYEGALHNLRRALSIRRREFGSKHALVGECLYGIATVLKMLGSFDEAMEGYEQALNVMKDAYGSEHVEVAKVLSDMGTMAELQGLHAEALGYFDEACQIREEVLGSESCEVANGLMRTAKSFERMNNLEDALIDAERAHGIFMEAFGENDYRTIAAHKMVERVSASQGETHKMLERVSASRGERRMQKENAFDNSSTAGTEVPNRRSAARSKESLMSSKSSASLASRPMIV